MGLVFLIIIIIIIIIVLLTEIFVFDLLFMTLSKSLMCNRKSRDTNVDP